MYIYIYSYTFTYTYIYIINIYISKDLVLHLKVPNKVSHSSRTNMPPQKRWSLSMQRSVNVSMVTALKGGTQEETIENYKKNIGKTIGNYKKNIGKPWLIYNIWLVVWNTKLFVYQRVDHH